MLKATIETQYLREMIDAITSIVTEFRLHVQEDGIRMRAVDTTNVAMVSVALARGAFKSFEATPGEMGIDAIKMETILESMPGALVTMEIVGNDEIEFDWTPPGMDWFDSHQYFMKILGTGSIRKDPVPPTLGLHATVEIPSDSLRTAMTTISRHTDKVVMVLSQGGFSLSGSDDNLKVCIQGPATQVKVTTRSIYSLDYLLGMVKAIPCGEMVRIAFADDHPMELAYYIAGNHGEVHFLMAPRIETG